MQIVVKIVKQEMTETLAWICTETMLEEVSTQLCLENEDDRFG